MQEENGRREVSGAKRSSKEAGQGGEMLSRLGQIVTKIGICKKKQSVVKLFYPKMCEGNNFSFFLHKWLANLHGFAIICNLPVAQTFKVMQSKIC